MVLNMLYAMINIPAKNRADADGHGARFFQESLTRPQFSGIVGNRHDLAADLGSEMGAAGLVTFFLSRRDAGAFRKHAAYGDCAGIALRTVGHILFT